MTFQNWVSPLLDYYKGDAEVFAHHIAQAPDGRFQLKDIAGALAKGIGWRHLYRVRNRLNTLAWIFEYEVEDRIIE